MSINFQELSAEEVWFPHNDAFNNLTALTVFAWIYPTDTDFGNIITKWRFVSFPPQDPMFVLAQHSSLGWFLEVAYDDTNNTDFETLGGTVDPGANTDEWYCGVGRWSTSAIELDALRLSTGETDNASTSISRTSISDTLSSTDLVIASQDDRGNYFDGGIGPWAIWNVTLNDREVAALLNRAHPRMIRPRNIIIGADFFSPDNLSVFGTVPLAPTAVNTPTSLGIHPPVMMGQRIVSPSELSAAAAAAAGTIIQRRRGSRRRR